MKRTYLIPEIEILTLPVETVMGLTESDGEWGGPGHEFDAKENSFFFDDEEEETVLAKPHSLWDDEEEEEW